MKRKVPKRLFALIAVLIMIPGCAMTVATLPLHYNVPDSLPSAFQMKPAKAIKVGKIRDRRGMENPHLIIHKTNLHGQKTSGGYAAEKPISEIIEIALKEALVKSNFAISDNRANYELYGDLMGFDLEVIQGWVSGTIKSRMTVNLYLKEKSTGQMIWNQTFIGRGNTKTGAFATASKLVSDSFYKAIDDLIIEIVSSEALQRFFL